MERGEVVERGEIKLELENYFRYNGLQYTEEEADNARVWQECSEDD